MIYYFVLVFVPIIFYFFLTFCNWKKERVNKVVILSFFVLFLFMLTFRSVDVGSDTIDYFSKYSSVYALTNREIISNYKIESGFYLFTKYVYFLSNGNFTFYLFIVSFLSVFPIALFYIKELKGNSVLAISLFLTCAAFSMYFSGLRQCLAMAFLVPIYYASKKKHFFLSLLLTFFAMTFHQSALLLFGVYFLVNIGVSKKMFPLIIVFVASVFLLKSQLFSFGLKVVGGKYSERYSLIAENGAYGMLIVFSFFLIFSFLLVEKTDDTFNHLRNIMIIIVTIQCFASLSSLVMRLNYYFMPVIAILIPNVLNKPPFSKKILINPKLLTISLSVFFIFYFFYKAFTGVDIMKIYPYVPNWIG